MTRLLAIRDWLLLIAALAVVLIIMIVSYGMLLERVVAITEMAR